MGADVGGHLVAHAADERGHNGDETFHLKVQ
jgi:hypothetical protein